MKSFSDFEIKPVLKGFQGKSIPVEDILNINLIIEDYQIKQSKYPEKGNGQCLYLQITIENTRDKHVVFTGSEILQETIKQIPDDGFPFRAKIKKENKRFEFRAPDELKVS